MRTPTPSAQRRSDARATFFAAIAVMLCLVAPAAVPATAEDEPPEPPRFEHLETGFALEGAHIDAGCETCHARQIFEGTPRRCSLCHVVGGTLATTGKPLQHVQTNEECDTCHDHYSWSGAFFVHGVTTAGRCSSCHNGASAPGKPADHIATTSQCDTCHRTQGWLPADLSGAIRRGQSGTQPRWAR